MDSGLANHPHSSEALGRFGHWIAMLKMEDYCARIVFVIYIGFPLRIWLYIRRAAYLQRVT